MSSIAKHEREIRVTKKSTHILSVDQCRVFSRINSFQLYNNFIKLRHSHILGNVSDLVNRSFKRPHANKYNLPLTSFRHFFLVQDMTCLATPLLYLMCHISQNLSRRFFFLQHYIFVHTHSS